MQMMMAWNKPCVNCRLKGNNDCFNQHCSGTSMLKHSIKKVALSHCWCRFSGELPQYWLDLKARGCFSANNGTGAEWVTMNPTWTFKLSATDSISHIAHTPRGQRWNLPWERLGFFKPQRSQTSRPLWNISRLPVQGKVVRKTPDQPVKKKSWLIELLEGESDR